MSAPYQNWLTATAVRFLPLCAECATLNAAFERLLSSPYERQRMIPSGEQYRLTAGDYTAVVTQLGATLRELLYRGNPVVRGFAEDEVMPMWRGAVLAPWPNRIGNGKYTFEGVEHQLPVNEPDRLTSLHGLVAWIPWHVESQSADTVTLSTRIWPQLGYEFLVDVSITYTLSADSGLTIRLTATNAGDIAAPYGSSIHPYLVAGDTRVDDWTMTVPVTTVIEVDDERLLPTGSAPVADTQFDFRRPRLVGSVLIDHAFTGVAAGDDGIAVARVVGPDGRGAEISWNAVECPWIQVHTADLSVEESSRRGMALEPMTCPPDAFRSGEGVVTLAPGEQHTATWVLRGIAN